jgi:hypothetical protein
MDLTINEPFSRWYTVGGVDDGDWWRLDCEFLLDCKRGRFRVLEGGG